MTKFQGWGAAIEAMKESKPSSTSISIQQANSVFTESMHPNRAKDERAPNFRATIRTLLRHKQGPWCREWILDTFSRDVMAVVEPLLNELDQDYNKDKTTQDSMKDKDRSSWMIKAFEELIQEIDVQVRSALHMAEFFDSEVQSMQEDESLKVSSKLVSVLSGQLVNALPLSFSSIAFIYFRAVFSRVTAEQMQSLDTHPGSTIPRSEPKGRLLQNGRKVRDLYESGDTEMHAIHLSDGSEDLGRFRQICSKLQHIGIATQMAEVATNMVHREIERLVFGEFARKWDTPALEQGKRWMSNVAIPFLRSTVLPIEHEGDHGMRKLFCLQSSRLEYYFYKCFGELRIQEYVDIVLDSPHSEPAVQDLHACLGWTGQQDQLLKTILQETSTRIAQPGAGTQQIIDYYIYNIKYLRILDPTGSLLDQTNRILNRHLRSRPETMRCIVEAIVDESGDLLNQPPEGIPSNVDSEDDSEAWVPEPAHAGPDLSTARRRMADIISVLVNIYKSNELFIEEFQAHLSTRLLQATDFDVDREIQQLELLKLRFKENELHHCEVMLADIAASKRVNGNIAEARPALPVQAAIVSRYYWPEIEETRFYLPARFQRYLDRYTAGFHDSKPAQRLTLLPSRGLVDIELEMRGQTFEFQISPLSASVISQFESDSRGKSNSLTLSDIATRLQVTETVAEPELRFWIDQDILREVDHHRYSLKPPN
ncbi:anaphase-promoting complex subunit 2 [Entomortierella parvispora]|uniref:Anaphase-promoting complex subunit 2 n=1 Tax=Entomortierella parvispora TaxID=205924 RepID=A0A9P3HB14_9FUNG|nr:anaphase-promoting complex subunit 2 [Entomortierella parvispora]